MVLCIALQPIVYGVTEDRLAHEVLARWLIDGRILPPGELASPIDWARIDGEIMSLILKSVEPLGHITPRLFINLSAETVSSPSAWSSWLIKLQQVLSCARFSVAIEISEDMNHEQLRAIWPPLKRLRVKMALDDYGRGHSTRARLTHFDWDYCKFEVSSLYEQDTISGLNFCKHSGIMPIIERVELAVDQNVFSVMGLHWQQGYHYGRPEILKKYLME